MEQIILVEVIVNSSTPTIFNNVVDARGAEVVDQISVNRLREIFNVLLASRRYFAGGYHICDSVVRILLTRAITQSIAGCGSWIVNGPSQRGEVSGAFGGRGDGG